MLEVVDICRNTRNFALKNINFKVENGDYFVLLGASGSGKTMLLELIAGIINPRSGKILLDNVDLSSLPIQKRGIGIVYQDQNLFKHLTVYENIKFPLDCQKKSKAEIEKIINEIAEEADIKHILNRKVNHLSGGEAQRVSIARTLAAKPSCLLLDEPLSFLDVQLRRGISSLLRKINQKGQTIIHVTHDYEEAISLATKVGIIENGELLQVGTPEDVFTHPKSEFVANFIGIQNFYKGKLIQSLHDDNLKIALVSDVQFHIATTESVNTLGNIIINGENITIANELISSSAINVFKGTIKDIIPIKMGLEVIVDIGIDVAAQITSFSFDKLQLELGKEIWISFKASAVKFIPTTRN